MLSLSQKKDFLTLVGWGDAKEFPVGEDWSQRKISRVQKGSRSAIVMHAVPDDDPRATPGHKLKDFVRLSAYLQSIGVSVPRIYEQDLAHGLLLVEDFGVMALQDQIRQGAAAQKDFYRRATNLLVHLYKKTETTGIDLPDYYAGHIHTGRRRVVDWYIPAVRKARNMDGLVESYLDVWATIEKDLPPVPRRFLHADFHPGNLMWLPERDGIQQIGVLDFQGGLMGPAPYDLVNLLDDARRRVPDAVRQGCLDLFLRQLPRVEAEEFMAWYPVLSCQFHCRVIGQAIRLAIKDSKPRLLEIIPILSGHLLRDLGYPVLAPLQKWFVDQRIDFSNVFPIVPAEVAPYIRPDAF